MGYTPVRTHFGDIYSLLMAGDVSFDVTKARAVHFVLGFDEGTKNFESQVTTMNSLAVVSETTFRFGDKLCT